MKKVLIIISLLLAGLLIGFIILNEPKPDGTAGVEAEKLADKMLKAVNYESWSQLGAVKWTFRGEHHYLWDKRRNLVEVQWDTYRVLLAPDTRSGQAYHNGQRVQGDESKHLLNTAWEYFANDSFWLAAPFKVRDPGTERKLVSTEQGDALLVTYHTGGVTPGDCYLWILDEQGLPGSWKMWVDIIPIGGMEFSWESWKSYTDDVKLASFRQGIVPLKLTDIATAHTVQELTNGQDPFELLFKN